MNTNLTPWDLAGDLRWRSQCRVKVAAVIVDRYGRIFSWGWNYDGPDGRGMCAERHAISRANRARLKGATIVVRGYNGSNESVSVPCDKCMRAILNSGIDIIDCVVNAKNKCRVSTHVDRIVEVNNG